MVKALEDRKDLFQEMMISLSPPPPRHAFQGFKGNSKVSTWIYRVCLNTAITNYRKEKGNNSGRWRLISN